MQIKKGSIDQTVYFHLRASADGTSKTGLLYNSAGAIASYVRTRGTRTAITLATLAAADSAHSDGGFIEVDGTNAKGLYRLDVPDAAFASGVDEVIIHIGFTGVFEESLAIELVDERPGNLKDDAITAAKIAANAIGSSEFAQAAADKVWATTERALTDKAGFALSAAGIDDIWNELMSGHTISGSFGQRLQMVRTGTAQAGGASTITLDAGASATDNFYNTEVIFILSGTGAGQTRKINSYVGSTKVASLASAWATNPDNTSVFIILPESVETGTGATAQQVWEYATRALSTPDDYKADISSLALEASLTAMKGAGWTTETLKAIKDAVDAINTAATADAVWDELQSGHTVAGSFGKYLDTEVSGVGGVGPGALSCTWTQKDSDENPIDNVQVWITTDVAGTNVIAGTLITNASGQVTFMLDAGTYYVWRERSGYNFTNPKTWSVS